MKKNLITVLKKLLTAFGGDAKDVKNNAVDIIDKIADSASGGGSGGGGVLYVNIIEKTNSTKGTKLFTTTKILDKTYKEIADTIADNKSVIVKTTLFSNMPGVPVLMPLTMYGYDVDNDAYAVEFVDVLNSNIFYFTSNAEDGEMVFEG